MLNAALGQTIGMSRDGEEEVLCGGKCQGPTLWGRINRRNVMVR